MKTTFAVVLAVFLVVLNAFLQILAYPGGPGLGNLIGFVVGMSLIGPGVLALLFCLPASRRTRRHYLSGFNTISFLLVAAAGLTAMKSVNQPPRTIATPDGTVGITVPADWKTPATNNPNVGLVLTDKMGVLSVMVTAIPKDPAAPLTLAELAGGAATMYPPDKVKASSGPFPCSVPALACTYYELRLDAGENGAVALVAFVEGRSRFYNVTAGTSEALYAGSKAELLEILATLKETGGATAP